MATGFKIPLQLASLSPGLLSTCFEDKQLGPYFINQNLVVDTIENNNKGREPFLDKVIMYLYTKICKYDKTIIFKEDFSITQLYDKFLSDNFIDVFNEDIQTELLFKQKETI